MAKRAGLSAPRQDATDWKWHEAKWSSIPASIIWGQDRRMEAENYLASGYGIRLAMSARTTGRASLGDLARVWQPSRLKGIQVSREYGTPFLAATQVFDLRPTPRKFLSLDRTDNVENRMVKAGTILVTCSGSVGRATLSHSAHLNTLISHDLLRVSPKDEAHWGWVYAFLRSPQGRAMMGAAQYGHVIKHLETSHLDALPVPMLRNDLLKKFQIAADQILELRTKSFEQLQEAEDIFASCFPSLAFDGDVSLGFSVRASQMFDRRRRLDASCFVPKTEQIMLAYSKHAERIDPLSRVTSRVFVPGRFKHIYGDGGMPYLDSADILEVNPDIVKFVLSLSEEEQLDYHVEPGWLLIPCSGQVYGNIGHTVMATEWHVGKVFTNHILRVCPNDRIRGGYLQCVMGHPSLGRPQIVRFAFGSSVPEISAADVATLGIPRLSSVVENAIADLMESSSIARDKADELEQSIAHEAELLIDHFIAGDSTAFIIP
ncbi:hypothetical protein GWL_09180 [Herbaspirillum sp. GW103]|uniref:hypothetical protein n=1 Tax=Herbaspirillum sp. GW103 TaxID=1175306 RepID=UPI00025E4553|nr:hypothetical protein [Herbaspirillum sp. GW103]EIJ46678.1 hypothetical protein GWL_09180 [Herbaspirillum sp. GW103]